MDAWKGNHNNNSGPYGREPSDFARKAASSPSGEDRKADRTRDGSMETILLLEDDAANREAIGLTLQLDGFAVEAAETPAQALHLCRTLPSLDLLVTDIGLPSGSGTETALEAMQYRGDLPVLFISGKPMEAWELRDQMYFRHFPAGKVDFLEKPFHASALQQKVRALLRSGPPEKKSHPSCAFQH